MKQITLLLFVLSIAFTSQSQTKISGTISENEKALPGANIIIKGTKTGTSTNIDGYFEIEAKQDDTLSISHLGYAKKEIVVFKQKTINVILEVDNKLDEVVVIGYSTKTTSCGMMCYNTKVIEEKAPKLKQSTIYPNPSSSGFFNLKLIGNYKKVQIQIANISGQIVQSSTFQNINKSVRLDLSKYPSGIYIINIIVDGERLPAKKAIIG